MTKANCEITVVGNLSRKAKIQLNKDGSSWKSIESSNGGLRLSASEGMWIAPFGWSKILTFLSNNNLILVVYKINDDFWSDLSSGKTVESNDASLFNGNFNEEKVTCKLSNGD